MGEWLPVKLDDVATLNGGFAFKSSQYTDTGHFVLRTVNITDDYAITRDGATFISESDAKDFARFALQPFDTLFVMVAATLGKVGFVRQKDLPALLNQNMWVIRAKPKKIDPIFLHYLFREISKIPLSWVSGSARSFLRRDDVRKLPFVLPSRGEQNAIANVLSSLDDKIELNRRMNATLERQAQAIFRDWFVDFGPVRRKMAMTQEGLASDPVAILGGLIPNPAEATPLAALFPDALGDDGLPLGWEEGSLNDLAKSAGRTIDPSEVDPNLPYIGLEHMPRKCLMLDQWGAASDVTSTKARFSKGQILFGKLRPYFHKVGIAPTDGVASTDILVLDAKAKRDRSLVACCVSTTEFVAFSNQDSDGTKMPRTSWAKLGRYPLTLASGEVCGAFDSVVSPMLERIVFSVGENRTLAETRDYLLPRLMSGKIRVADAERAVG